LSCSAGDTQLGRSWADARALGHNTRCRHASERRWPT